MHTLHPTAAEPGSIIPQSRAAPAPSQALQALQALHARPRGRWLSRTTKRLFDVSAAVSLLVVLSPALAAIAWRVGRDGGPCLYGHPRIGKGGRPFKCLKFRSMVPDAEARLKSLLESDPAARAEWEATYKLRNDIRVTAIGRLLRRTSLDELPQLWNVVRGEMSLVGPRPVVEKELQRYGACAAYYLQVPPGITGPWQVSGRNDTSYEDRVALDLDYVTHWSLARDIGILFRTVGVVLRRRGAY
ncbi:Undecaprenyl-phosphate galactose phosphotransferase WbaP [Cupriavidus agavae]|uniref:Undecaprenyl-phosphate galactose phosphotransferase WbaP n=1 Tax=Cupriavidus agavae TaxID=1001822 RepID=A0A4Q7S8R1_9BURK|nr:Undecaprenyl-phosphate galactose phosphotransferase WbaP [Cupriavidus agavae]